MFSFDPYVDPDYGILLPTALVLASLGTTEYQVRKFRPLLTENEDYLRIRGEDYVERIFYSASGLIKLCEAIASPQSQALKQHLIQYLQTRQSALTSLTPGSAQDAASRTPTVMRGHSIVPAPSPAVQLYHPSGSRFDPYAPASTYHPPAPQIAPSVFNSDSSSLPPSGDSNNPAQQFAQQLAPHLSEPIASQVSTRVDRALDRLQNRQSHELSQAELLLQQQRLSLEQFQIIQQSILAAQKAAAENTQTIIGAIPTPEVNLFNSVQVDQTSVPPDLWNRMLAVLQIRTWSDLLMAVGGLVALGLSGVLVLGLLMRPSQRLPDALVPPATPSSTVAPVQP